MADTPSTWTGDERRGWRRYRRTIDVACRVADAGDEPFTARSGDLSIRGVSILSPHELPTGARVQLTISSKSDGASVELSGIVRQSGLPRSLFETE